MPPLVPLYVTSIAKRPVQHRGEWPPSHLERARDLTLSGTEIPRQEAPFLCYIYSVFGREGLDALEVLEPFYDERMAQGQTEHEFGRDLEAYWELCGLGPMNITLRGVSILRLQGYFADTGRRVRCIAWNVVFLHPRRNTRVQQMQRSTKQELASVST